MRSIQSISDIHFIQFADQKQRARKDRRINSPVSARTGKRCNPKLQLARTTLIGVIICTRVRAIAAPSPFPRRSRTPAHRTTHSAPARPLTSSRTKTTPSHRPTSRQARRTPTRRRLDQPASRGRRGTTHWKGATRRRTPGGTCGRTQGAASPSPPLPRRRGTPRTRPSTPSCPAGTEKTASWPQWRRRRGRAY